MWGRQKPVILYQSQNIIISGQNALYTNQSLFINITNRYKIAMNKLEKISKALKQSKFEIFRHLRSKQLYRSQTKEKNKISLTDYTRNELYFSVVHIDSTLDTIDVSLKDKDVKKKKSTHQKRNNHLITSIFTMKEKRKAYFKEVGNNTGYMDRSLSKSVQLNETQSFRSHIRSVEERRKKEFETLNVSASSIFEETVMVMKPKRESLFTPKMSNVRIKTMKKGILVEQKVQNPQNNFELRGWQTRQQQEFFL